MERLTFRNANGVAFWLDHGSAEGGYRPIDPEERERLDRLADYEDIDMEPHEIMSLIDLPSAAPLTIEELDRMKGDPVWLSGWGLDLWDVLEGLSDGMAHFYRENLDLSQYGDIPTYGWLAYREKPKDEI